VFHDYDLNQCRIVRLLLRKKIDLVMRSAALVVVGNQYLAERAHQAGAKWVEYLPTSIPLSRYSPVKREPNGPFTVVWIGTPMTAKSLGVIERPLAKASLHCRINLKLIGSGPVQIPGVRTEVLPWSEEKEVAELQTSDIGVMPLFDTPFNRGKCGYKLIQYMACGKAVVASPVGANRTIVSDGSTGFWANSDEEWTNSLLRLHDDSELRVRMGAAGRAKVEADYCTEVIAPKLARLLVDATE
jgi:glycosyltransferase involved in cell wall biosynthesis